MGTAREKKQLDLDMEALLLDGPPRQVGEMPPELGKYERIAPGEIWDAVLKVKHQIFRPDGRRE